MARVRFGYGKGGKHKVEWSIPMDDEHRDLYMEEEKPLDQVWEEVILRTRSLDKIKKEAKNGCVRSKIELDHINRNK